MSQAPADPPKPVSPPASAGSGDADDDFEIIKPNPYTRVAEIEKQFISRRHRGEAWDPDWWTVGMPAMQPTAVSAALEPRAYRTPSSTIRAGFMFLLKDPVARARLLKFSALIIVIGVAIDLTMLFASAHQKGAAPMQGVLAFLLFVIGISAAWWAMVQTQARALIAELRLVGETPPALRSLRAEAWAAAQRHATFQLFVVIVVGALFYIVDHPVAKAFFAFLLLASSISMLSTSLLRLPIRLSENPTLQSQGWRRFECLRQTTPPLWQPVRWLVVGLGVGAQVPVLALGILLVSGLGSSANAGDAGLFFPATAAAITAVSITVTASGIGAIGAILYLELWIRAGFQVLRWRAEESARRERVRPAAPPPARTASTLDAVASVTRRRADRTRPPDHPAVGG